MGYVQTGDGGRRFDMTDDPNPKTRTFTEEIEIAGKELVERVNAILAEGKVRQLRIKAEDGDVYLETPLTIGVLAGGAITLAAPWLAILGALAALLTHVKIEVVREVDDDGAEPPGKTGS
jgi:hypothetical protein